MSLFIKRLAVFSLALFAVISFSFTAQALDVGTGEVNATIGLGSDSPIVIVARVINITMIFLGVISVILMLYAGFKWMTAAGKEEQIDEAKRTLKNASIGLLIILSSWAIVSFILGRFFGVPGQLGSQNGNNNGNNENFGLGALGNCSISEVYPNPGQRDIARNSAIMITFKEDVSNDFCTGGSVCDGSNFVDPEIIKIFESELGDQNDTNITNVYAQVLGNTIILKPKDYLGSPVATLWYTVHIESGMKKANGDPLFSDCSTDYLAWQFEVSNRLDLSPPQVVSTSLFPTPDSQADDVSASVGPKFASGNIKILSQPLVDRAPFISSVVKNPSASTWNIATATAHSDYSFESNSFIVTVVGQNRAQLYQAGTSLGTAILGSDNTFDFPGYFSLKIGGDGQSAQGNSWSVAMTARQSADWLKIGSKTYTFGLNVRSLANLDSQAQEIATVLSGRDDIEVEATNNQINIKAKEAGSGGNSIEILASGPYAGITALSGGTDQSSSLTVKDKADKPMNSLIQVTFNEPINPVAISGKSSEVDNTLQVVNANWATSLEAGQSCNKNSDCLSYSCQSGACVGNYVSGNFTLSNGYKTLEFKADNECGVNGCGEKIYCLPAGSHLTLAINAAPSTKCNNNDSCTQYSPYSKCSLLVMPHTTSSYTSCNDDHSSYPLSDISMGFGVTDSAFNSLDGNHDGLVWGNNATYYDENIKNTSYGDNARWSFFISDKIEAGSPAITNVEPSSGSNVALSDNIKITFNKLMAAQTMTSGVSGNHKLINLYLKTGNNSAGYWIGSQTIDQNNDGEADYTIAEIKHSSLTEGLSYRSQVGSGVRDIYQNCFKPSAGPGCSASDINPSCCFGVSTAQLDEDGNCQ